MVSQLSEAEIIAGTKAKKFIVWLFVASSAIMFGGWTSYYIVFSAAKGKGHGLVLPDMFMYSTAVLILSSICLFLASRAFRQGNISSQKTLLWITMLLGIVFAVLQYLGWKNMLSNGAAFINNNASITMIYVLSLFHVFHIIVGLTIISGALIGTYKKIDNSRIAFRMQISSIFWHFIDILWIYLYVFLLLNS